MNSTLTNSDLPRPLTTLQRNQSEKKGMTSMWMAVGDQVIPVDIASPWASAREKACVKQSYLAYLMGIPESQLCDQIANRGNVSLQRLARLKDDEDGQRFLGYFMVELAQQFGFNLDELIAATAIQRVAQKWMGRLSDQARRVREVIQ